MKTEIRNPKIKIKRTSISNKCNPALPPDNNGNAAEKSGEQVFKSPLLKDGNVGIGTTSPSAKLDVHGTINGSGNCAGAVCDIAEEFTANKHEPLESGDVLIIDQSTDEWHLTKSKKAYDAAIAGIYTSTPAVYMGGGIQIGDFHNFTKLGSLEHDGKIPLALAGRVPVKVTNENGIIQKGDLLTTSSTPGYAMKCEIKDIDLLLSENKRWQIIAENEKCRNSIIGKALEPMEENKEKIMALITLQ